MSSILKVLIYMFSLLSATVGTMPTTAKTQVRDCVVKMRKQKVVPVRSNCFERTVPLPFCFGFCRTTDELVVNGEEITGGPHCACCQPRTFKEMELKFVCATNSGARKIFQETIKVPLACSCSRCTEEGYSSRKAPKPKAEEKERIEVELQ